ncbi:MAG: c-type cytochrome [Gemmataceae bacterium]|nr:c-type cytochrome [Gemmataceae bacterium]
MKSPSLLWYLVALLVVLTPVGLRVAFWQGHTPPAADASSIEAGKTLFTHEWKPNDPLAGGGDGLGPVFNASSCVACHRQGGLGGSGGLEHNVTTFLVQPTTPNGKTREGVVHARASQPQFQETLALVNGELPRVARPALASLLPNQFGRTGLTIPIGVQLSQRNTPALFGSGLIDSIPDRVIIAEERWQRLRHGLAPVGDPARPIGKAPRLAEGRVGKFGWKGQSGSLLEFVQAACANELGLGNPGSAQPAPLGKPDYRPAGLDLTTEQCQQMTAFIAGLVRPTQKLPDDSAARTRVQEGERLFHKVGCADCHTPDLGSVAGLYSDLLLHRMGAELIGGSAYYGDPTPVANGPSSSGLLPDEWRTPPLWGVADSAPYLHDGRAKTLAEAIQLHRGQAEQSAARFSRLPSSDQARVIEFLKSLRAP